MKYRCFVYLSAIFFLLAACGAPQAQPEAYTEPGFPPGEEDFAQALRKVGMDWTIQERPAALGEISEVPIYALHIIGNDNGNAYFNLRYEPAQEAVNDEQGDGYGLDYDKQCNVTFVYFEQTIDDYHRLLEEECSDLWALSGRLLDAFDSVGALRQQCMDYYNSYNGRGQGNIDWYGSEGQLFCCANFM